CPRCLKQQKNNTTSENRVNEFEQNVLPADDGKLFCTSCCVLLDYTQRATVQHHLESKTDLHKKRAVGKEPQEGAKKKKMINVEEKTESTEVHCLATVELANVNVPLKKLDHTKLRDLQHNVKITGGLPRANKLRQDYFPRSFRHSLKK
ncbi:LOW QUALITY PROTEIN: CGG triplet repeat-binding protein 1-like, partial [Colossoma macropomum]|uniref:LOW QUALITY PROTEIN: CGG triplet repeat-binding protein 1-like n=1 Tax=Colossoma macropomum TaxID=42526 RepID=UPI0018648A9B